MLSADGADGSHVFVAIRKALVALTFGQPSAQAREQILKDKASLARVTPQYVRRGRRGADPDRRSRSLAPLASAGAGGAVMAGRMSLCAAAGLETIKNQLNKSQLK